MLRRRWLHLPGTGEPLAEVLSTRKSEKYATTRTLNREGHEKRSEVEESACQLTRDPTGNAHQVTAQYVHSTTEGLLGHEYRERA